VTTRSLVFSALLVTGLGLAPACAKAPAEADAPIDSPLAVGDSRTLELRYLRFDVSNFTQTYTKKDVLALPDEIKSRLWLLDLDLSNGPNSPRLLDNALAAIKKLDPSTLTPASRNLQRLLLMTPATADLKGTSLEQLISLAPLLGIAPEQVLADLLNVNVEDTFLSSTVVSETILKQVISSHPNARVRSGPVTADHPDGLYEVPYGFLPVTLADAASDFASLSQRYGPISSGGVVHPGFIFGQTKSVVLTDSFKMTVKANANALPYKGVELSKAAVASVNSIPSQVSKLFDFEDPTWLTMEGLVQGEPKIESLTFRISDGPAFYPGGRSPLPTGQGDSPAWKRPAWEAERVVLGAAQAGYQHANATISYAQPGAMTPLFSATVKDGWAEISVKGNIGSPPPPSYLWDFLLEAAEIRLHDGGIPPGMAGVEFTLANVPVGTDTASISATIRENLKANPAALLDVAARITDNSKGAADFYYYRPNVDNPATVQGDWLFFLDPSDIAKDSNGKATRTYDYTSPGFFADMALTKKLSSTGALDGDVTHEKIRVSDNDSLYVQGAGGRVFHITIGAKPSLNHRLLTVTRVK
jgi:hypothetical protein